MKRRIRTYEDLEREEQLLEELLRSQKELIQIEVGLLKKQLRPAQMALQFVARLTTADKHNPLLTGGANTLIDTVLKNFVLARSGWITKMLVPFFVKNYSSHLINANKDTLINKVVSIFTNKNGRHDTSPVTKGQGN